MCAESTNMDTANMVTIVDIDMLMKFVMTKLVAFLRATSSAPNHGSTKIVYRHLNIPRLDVPNLTSTSPLIHQMQKTTFLYVRRCWLAMPLGAGILRLVVAFCAGCLRAVQ